MTRTGNRVLGIVGIVLLVLGVAGWALQLSGGLLANSGMDNIFLWGLMIAMFAFMVGFGAGAQMVASALYLWAGDGMLPIARKAAAIGLACVGAAGVAILADLGALRNIMAMIVGLNLRSPLAWDMIAITAFVVVSIVQLVMMARGAASTKGWVVAAGVVALALQVVEGLLFSTQTAHAWWATPIMPIDFVAVALVSGSALMVLVASCTKQPEGSVAWLARFCAWAIAVHLVLALGDLMLVFFEGTPQAGGVLAAIGDNIAMYLCELLLPAVAMVLFFTVARGGNAKNSSIAAGIAILGIFYHRLMLLYPAYNAPSLYLTLSGTDEVTGAYPISTGRYLDWDQTFALGTPYAPAPAEWLAALLPIGFAVVATFIILWAMRKIGQESGAKQ